MANTKKEQPKANEVKPEETKVDVEKAAEEAVKTTPKEPEVKEEEKKKEQPKAKDDEKLKVVETMLKNSKKKEADKQRRIYSAMSGITVIRN